MGTNVEPNEDISKSLEEKEGDEGEHRDEGEQVPGGLPLGQLLVRRGVTDEEDGDGGQTNVRHHVLIVTWLRPNLTILLNNYPMK